MTDLDPDPLAWLKDVDLDGMEGDWREAKRPIENREWQRQGHLIIGEQERIIADQRFKSAIGSVAFLAVQLILTPEPTDTQERILRAAIDGTIGFVGTQSPTLRHLLRPDGLRRWVFGLIDARVLAALGEIGAAADGLGAMAGQLRLVHPGPDNPSELQTGGSAIIPAEASDVHRRQVRDLQRSRRAPGKAGAKKGSHHAKKRPPLPPAVDCERAVTLWTDMGIKESLAKLDPSLRAPALVLLTGQLYRRLYPDDQSASPDEMCTRVKMMVKRGYRLLGLPPD